MVNTKLNVKDKNLTMPGICINISKEMAQVASSLGIRRAILASRVEQLLGPRSQSTNMHCHLNETQQAA